MWVSMWILLLVFAIILLLFSVLNEDHPFWNIISMMISFPLWWILGYGQLEIEFPYVAITTSDTIVSGYEIVTSPISPFLLYFFFGVGVICFIYMWAMIWDKWYNYKNWHGGN